MFRMAIALAFALIGVPAGATGDGGTAPGAPERIPFRIDPTALKKQGGISLDGFPVAPGRFVTLALEPFSITSGRTRFVVGHKGRADTALAFDPASVMLLRGGIEGEPGSRVFLAVSAYGCMGTVDRGQGRPILTVSCGPEGRQADGSYTVTVGPEGGDGAWPAVPFCGVSGPQGPLAPALIPPEAPADGGPIRGLQRLQVAVETDYEYFEQAGAGDLNVAAAYALMVYGSVSDIYIRDVNTAVDLSYLRLWDNPDDLFNEPDPLDAFREYWNANMGGVERDVAQFFSGRRDLWAGGVAWVGALCGDYGYSWVGYINGLRPSASGPVIPRYDTMVAAHELGHNCGVYHTHDYGIDTCNDPATPPRRGGIMSYCGQTFSGGNLNMDMRFETLLQGIMRDFIGGSVCILDDCNGNGIADSLDIGSGQSADADGDGQPDECEDCNGNGIVDSVDIAAGRSTDFNDNGVPDECEPDCNGNGLPDAMDIAQGTSLDIYLDGVPDECQTDCNDNGVADYNEIQADMSLDVDRNAALDSCQDCDADGVTDMAALGHSRNLWVASLAEGGLREFYSASGVLTQVSDPGGLSSAQDVVITPGGRIFVSSFDNNRIAEFGASGEFVGDFVGPKGAGLTGPTAMMLTPVSLIVSSSGTDSVLEFRLPDGGYVRTVVAPGTGGLKRPFGLSRSPSGTLVIAGADNRVAEFDFFTGQYLRDLVPAGSGGLSTPRGIAYKPDGNLLVVSFDNRSVLEYDGPSGAFVKKWNRGGTEDRLALEEPWGIRVGPDGNVYVSTSRVERDDPGRLHLTRARVFEFDIRTGNLLRAYVEGDDTGLYRPSGFDFYPASPEDCNGNNLPDSCDIASGVSQDADGDGVPDECQCYADCDRSGALDLFDFLCFVNAFVAGEGRADCDGSGGLDLFDFLCYQNAFAAGCG